MEIKGLENIPKLFISPIEKMMDEFKGSMKQIHFINKFPTQIRINLKP